MNRRAVLAGLTSVVGFPLIGAPAAAQTLTPLWQAWKQAFLLSSGRVVDGPQQNASHSEGQAYGLLLAEAMGDEESFRLILNWSFQHLFIRSDDMLMVWRWLPEERATPDQNNATDGDLIAAWAMQRAAKRFRDPDLAVIASSIIKDISRLCVAPCPWRAERLILLPGVDGFQNDEGVLQNLSYYVFPALQELAPLDASDLLSRLGRDGMDLAASVGRTSLPQDWMRLGTNGPMPDPAKSNRFGYDAMRVPLNLVWGGYRDHPIVRRAAQIYAGFLASGTTPTRITADGTEILETSGDPGYGALAALSLCASGLMPADLPVPAFRADQPYYPASLHLLTLLAQSETTLSCL